jgi:hypothetical protein
MEYQRYRSHKQQGCTLNIKVSFIGVFQKFKGTSHHKQADEGIGQISKNQSAGRKNKDTYKGNYSDIKTTQRADCVGGAQNTQYYGQNADNRNSGINMGKRHQRAYGIDAAHKYK